MKSAIAAFSLLACLSLTAPAVAMAGAQGAVPLAMLPRVAAPIHYRLALTIDPSKDRFSGHEEIAVRFTTPRKSIFIHGLDLHVGKASLRLGNKSIAAQYAQVDKSGVARLDFEREVPAGLATLIFDYDAPFNKSLSGLYKVIDRGEAYAFTQFENIDARRAFPSFDEPGFKTPFDVTVIAPAADKVIGNTPLVSSASAGAMTKWVFETTKPLPTYLIALAVGPLDIVDAGDIPPNKYRDRALHLRGIAAKGKGVRLKYALSLTPSVVNALEAYYGIGFPYQKLDILAVPDFAAGAMENAGAVTFREQLLLMDGNAPLDQKRNSLLVQAHELAHQWFGDLVTPKWWDDIWLNESFATWMEYKIAQTVSPEQQFSRDRLRSGLNVMDLDELPSARQIHNPVRNPDDIDNAFDQITYSKGGAVLAMFESYLSPKVFQEGIHAYLTKFAFKNATASDFIGTVGQATGHSEIVQAFDDYINQPHIPLMSVALSCAPDRAGVQVAEATYMPIGIQLQAGKWHVPMCIAADRARSCSLVSPPSGRISLGAKCPASAFPNDQGAGYYRFSVPDWQALIKAAPALSAADQLTLLHNVAAALHDGQAPATDVFVLISTLSPSAEWDFVDAIRSTLHDMRVTGLIPAADLPALQAFVRKKFDARLAQIGLAAKPGEPAGTALLRQHLVGLLVEEGQDAGLTSKLAKAARVYLASGGKNNGGISAELRQEALRAGVMAQGLPFANELMEAIKKSNDEFFIQSAIYAIAGAEDAETLNKLLALALTPSIRTGDLRYVTVDFAAEAAARPVLWNWFKENFASIEKRLSRRGMSSTPGILRFACEPQAKDDLAAFFGPKTGELVGTPRVLRQTEERIERCIAFKRAKGNEIRAALKSVM